MKYPAGMILFAGNDCPEHLEAAREYIKVNKLTNEDVKLLRTDCGSIVIKVKRDIDYGRNNSTE